MRAAECAGDCDGDRVVEVGEVITGVGIALRRTPLDRCRSIDGDGDQEASVDELIVAVSHSISQCPPPDPTLGVRRFSIDPASSPLVTVLDPDTVVSSLPGFTGFLELTAGEPDPETGLAFVDVTDASEFIAIDIPNQPATLCLRPVREALPLERAGVVACDAGLPVSLEVLQDHRLGEVGLCLGGDDSGEPCGEDGGCTTGQCFDEQDCAAAGGRVEGEGESHPGVCNGPLTVRRGSADSNAGDVLIARDDVLGTCGLPVEVAMERSSPCGDEDAPAVSAEIGLTSDFARVRIASFNAAESAMLDHVVVGESFSCDDWRREDGPGTLAFANASLDVPALPDVVTDLVTVFVWDD